MKNRIKKCREKAGLSVDDLSAKLGWSGSPVVLLAEENADPLFTISGKGLEMIARALHTNPAYLIGWSSDPKPMKERRYTVQTIKGDEGSFLNKIIPNDDYFYADDEVVNGTQTYFTQAEIDELKKRDDIAIDWYKAIIEPVEDSDE